MKATSSECLTYLSFQLSSQSHYYPVLSSSLRLLIPLRSAAWTYHQSRTFHGCSTLQFLHQRLTDFCPFLSCPFSSAFRHFSSSSWRTPACLLAAVAVITPPSIPSWTCSSDLKTASSSILPERPFGSATMKFAVNLITITCFSFSFNLYCR